MFKDDSNAGDRAVMDVDDTLSKIDFWSMTLNWTKKKVSGSPIIFRKFSENNEKCFAELVKRNN